MSKDPNYYDGIPILPQAAVSPHRPFRAEEQRAPSFSDSGLQPFPRALLLLGISDRG